MTNVFEAAAEITRPLFTDVAQVIDFTVYTDRTEATGKDLTGVTVTMLLKDSEASPTTRTYTAAYDGANDVRASGTGHFTLNASWHVTAGDAEGQLLLDGIPVREYAFTFRTTLS